MSELLLHYRRPDPATWAYLSSFLMIGLFFVFHRFWSIRNLDILLLILLSPGLLMVSQGRRNEFLAQEQLLAHQTQVPNPSLPDPVSPDTSDKPEGQSDLPPEEANFSYEAAAAEDQAKTDSESPKNQNDNKDQNDKAEREAQVVSAKMLQRRGFAWLLTIQLLILLRLMLDSALVRRPLLDPNLSTGGLNFIGISLLVFLMANVVTSSPQLHREQGPQLGPGYPLLNALPMLSTRSVPAGAERHDFPSSANKGTTHATIARVLAVIAHLAVVIGIVLIGYRHFSNLRAGVGCATLYLLLPYTALMTGRVDHVMPAATLVWAILMYRKPFVAGIFVGLAAGLVYYPLFLLPLWLSFYWQRGVGRFAGGVAVTLVVLMAFLSLEGTNQFDDRIVQMYGLWKPTMRGLQGIWGLGLLPFWRLPILVAYILLAGLYSLWPAQKNLGTLISCSASLMVAAQFWHGYGGGLYVAWFLPLLLLTIFRPNLEDRVALKVIGKGQNYGLTNRNRTATEAA